MDATTLVLAGVLGAMVVAAAAYSVATSLHRRRGTGGISAIDFARGAFARQLSQGVPMAELLLQIAEALRDTFKLDVAEVWVCEGGALSLAAAEPARERTPISLTPAEESIVANARVSGVAWAKVWLPALLEGRADASLRVAPIAVSGQLLGLMVIERSRKGDSLPDEADAILDEVARELAVGINKARLDAALRASLEQLRRQAADLRASRGRLVAAADEERRRIERNLHDGAQQHLVGLAVKVRLLEQLAERDPVRAKALMQELQGDVSATIDELRSLAHGIYPPLLSSSGLGEALAAACRRASVPASLESDGVGRHPPEVETAIYFCCLEALQNVGKYAGDGASAHVRLWEEAGGLLFEVDDDGAGFDPNGHAAGAGLTNMRDRLGAVGGTLRVESAVGQGTRVRGAVPITTTKE